MGEWQFHYRIADCVLSATGEDAELGALAASLYEGLIILISIKQLLIRV